MAERARTAIAQCGTKHSHAAGWAEVLLSNPDVDLVGVYEPDAGRRYELESGGSPPWSEARWIDDPAEFLESPDVTAVAAEGSNAENLGHAEQIVAADKHLLLDKPAGDDLARFKRVVDTARERGLIVQLGYMFRHHDGFQRIAGWARDGTLGEIFAIRAHMSVFPKPMQRAARARHRGGVFFDLAGHMLDQIVWILGRPTRVSSFMQEIEGEVPSYTDSGVAVLEYERALVMVDIAGLETDPPARRFEVYGRDGSAIMEPFEPAQTVRLCLRESRAGYPPGVTTVEIEDRPRYAASLAAFVRTLRGDHPMERGLDHELLVQETLLRSTGALLRLGDVTRDSS